MKIRVKILIDKNLSPMLWDKSSEDLVVDLSNTRKCRKPWKACVVPEWATEPKGSIDASRYIQETTVERSVVERTSDCHVVAQQHDPICAMVPCLYGHLIAH